MRSSCRLPLRLAALTLAACSLAGCAFAAGPRVTNLAEIKLHPGVNDIRRLAPDDRSGVIVESWRATGAATGYPLYLMMLPNPEPARGWSVVSLDGANAVSSDTIGGRPDSAIRFARGKLAGVPQTFLIIATLKTTAAPSPATITIYRLQAGGVRDGTTPDHFSIVSSTTTRTAFCNADMALRDELGLPLPDLYGGPFTPDGCTKRG